MISNLELNIILKKILELENRIEILEEK